MLWVTSKRPNTLTIMLQSGHGDAPDAPPPDVPDVPYVQTCPDVTRRDQTCPDVVRAWYTPRRPRRAQTCPRRAQTCPR
eukprot:3958145-Prymnesium_polylepis.1